MPRPEVVSPAGAVSPVKKVMMKTMIMIKKTRPLANPHMPPFSGWGYGHSIEGDGPPGQEALTRKVRWDAAALRGEIVQLDSLTRGIGITLKSITHTPPISLNMLRSQMR